MRAFSPLTRGLFVIQLFIAMGCQVHIKTPSPPTNSSLSTVPVITSIFPPDGPTTGGTQITINGQLFTPGSTVTIGSQACNSIVFVSADELQCVVPANVAGSVNVVVANPDQQVATASYLYYVQAQSQPNFAINLGGGASVGHAGGNGVSANAAIGESASAQIQTAVGISAKSGIVNVTSP